MFILASEEGLRKNIRTIDLSMSKVLLKKQKTLLPTVNKLEAGPQSTHLYRASYASTLLGPSKKWNTGKRQKKSNTTKIYTIYTVKYHQNHTLLISC